MSCVQTAGHVHSFGAVSVVERADGILVENKVRWDSCVVWQHLGEGIFNGLFVLLFN